MEGSRRGSRGIPRVLARLPKVAVHTRKDMARLLRRYRWLLDAIAQQHLGETPQAQEAVDAVVARMLALDEPDMPHALRTVTRGLHYDCYRIRREQQRPPSEAEQSWALGVPYDAVLGRRVTGTMAEAAESLPPAERAAYKLAVLGVRVGDIASALKIDARTATMRLYRARQRITRSLSERLGAFLLPLAGSCQWAVRRLSDRRTAALRGLRGHFPHDATAWLASPVINAAALMSLVAWSLASIAAPSAATSPATGRLHDGAATAAAPSPALHDVSHRNTVPELRGSPVRNAGRSAGPAAPQGLLGAAAETPDDVRLTATADPPASGPPALVAIGQGRSCQCSVLLRSLDGGVTWTASDGPPPGVTQLVLPPDYPTDPRIFAGTDAYGASPPLVAAAFGGPFQAIGALPPGQIAVSAHFAGGDARVFVAALTGVWSLDLAASSRAAPRLEIEYTSAVVGMVAAIAMPRPSDTGPALLAWVPAGSSVPGTLGTPRARASVMACPPRGLCEARSDLPGVPWRLAVGADAGGAVTAYTPTSMFVSRDGGESFVPVALPTETAVASVAMVGESGEVWASFATNSGAKVARLTDAAAWQDETRGDAALQSHSAGALLSVDHLRVLDALPNAGYRCAAVPSGAWLPRCPAF
jgi:DNA-directed RNA polymerase specialized sigma24 family protein